MRKFVLALLFLGMIPGQASASRLFANTLPAERQRGCVFSEKFQSQTLVERNDGTIIGTPTFSFQNGMTCNGTTDYADYNLTGQELNSANLSMVFVFSPDDAADSGRQFFLMDDSTGLQYSVIHVTSNNLQVYVGGVVAASCLYADYQAYWDVGARNVLVFSGTSGANKLYLNGNDLTLLDPVVVWSPTTVTGMKIGSRDNGTQMFGGVFHGVQFYQAILTGGEAQDFYDQDTYSWRENIVAHWKMRLQDHDDLNQRTLPVGANFTGIDVISGNGDVETWTGSEGNCTNCPTGFSCLCTSGDLVREDTAANVYSGSYSIEMDPGAAYDPGLVYLKEWTAGKCYAVSFCYKGSAGTEDFYFLVSNTSLTDSYDLSTHTWTGAASGIAVTDASTAWVCENMFVDVGLVTKPATTYGFTVVATSSDGTAVWFDNFQVDELDSCMAGVHAPVKHVSHGYRYDGVNDLHHGTIPVNLFNTVELFTMVEFSPDFNWEEDATRYLFDTDNGVSGGRTLVVKAKYIFIQEDFELKIFLGNTNIVEIPKTTYGPHWRQGQRNVLVVAGDSVNNITNVWLNKEHIVIDDTTPWTPATDASRLTIGARNARDAFFDGVIHSFLMGNISVTPLQMYDINLDIKTRRNQL